MALFRFDDCAPALWRRRQRSTKQNIAPHQLTQRQTYLHDELDGTNEETQELEQKVLLLLLHLVETELPAALQDLFARETNTGVSLEHLLRDNASAAGGDLFLLLELKTDIVSAMHDFA